LIVAALLLGIDKAPVDREGRPARSDGTAPQLDRLRPGPVGVDPHAANHAVAPRSPKAGPADARVRCGGICATLLCSLRVCRRRRRDRRLITGLCRKPCVGGGRGRRGGGGGGRLRGGGGGGAVLGGRGAPRVRGR